MYIFITQITIMQHCTEILSLLIFVGPFSQYFFNSVDFKRTRIFVQLYPQTGGTSDVKFALKATRYFNISLTRENNLDFKGVSSDEETITLSEQLAADTATDCFLETHSITGGKEASPPAVGTVRDELLSWARSAPQIVQSPRSCTISYLAYPSINDEIPSVQRFAIQTIQSVNKMTYDSIDACMYVSQILLIRKMKNVFLLKNISI